MNLVYHVYIERTLPIVKYSTLSIGREYLTECLSTLYMDYQIELKLGIL